MCVCVLGSFISIRQSCGNTGNTIFHREISVDVDLALDYVAWCNPRPPSYCVSIVFWESEEFLKILGVWVGGWGGVGLTRKSKTWYKIKSHGNGELGTRTRKSKTWYEMKSHGNGELGTRTRKSKTMYS